ncbi:hypothetical protein FB45DRAFT_1121666 [Roridomyces roridus]|uniref:Uncharacterized protein n=1 Tax=Roridomyces roridus TaxID=1738132 RepID=A0AAD7B4P7_9AGAR|nr:hypothetical protein FB45DRAFT_1121666 [Roridomyces roridus]
MVVVCGQRVITDPRSPVAPMRKETRAAEDEHAATSWRPESENRRAQNPPISSIILCVTLNAQDMHHRGAQWQLNVEARPMTLDSWFIRVEQRARPPPPMPKVRLPRKIKNSSSDPTSPICADLRRDRNPKALQTPLGATSYPYQRQRSTDWAITTRLCCCCGTETGFRCRLICELFATCCGSPSAALNNKGGNYVINWENLEPGSRMTGVRDKDDSESGVGCSTVTRYGNKENRGSISIGAHQRENESK